MNIDKNARTMAQSRALMVHRVMREHWPVSAVTIAFGVKERTVYSGWLAVARKDWRAWGTDVRLPSAAHTLWRRHGWR